MFIASESSYCPDAENGEFSKMRSGIWVCLEVAALLALTIRDAPV